MGQATDTLPFGNIIPYFFEPKKLGHCSNNRVKYVWDIWFRWSQQSEDSTGSLYIEKAEKLSPKR